MSGEITPEVYKKLREKTEDLIRYAEQYGVSVNIKLRFPRPKRAIIKAVKK